MDHIFQIIRVVFLLSFYWSAIETKYMDGELNSSENWAFLARFCFLSEQGTFEFYFEFKNDQGYPNLLLYYDAPDQWQSIYKTDKTCRQKESVLHIKQRQIVNLTADAAESGCTYHILDANDNIVPKPKTTQKPKKAVTHIVNLGGTKRTTQVTTTPLPQTSTTDFVNYTESLEPYDNNATDIYDMENFFGEDISNISDIPDQTKPIVKRSVPRPVVDKSKSTVLITCRNARKFKSSRARWWFLALSNCDGHKGIHVKYQILMTNGRPGDFWHEHFSADEFYVLPVLMAFAVAYGMLIFSIIICSVELKSRQLLHSTYKLFVISVILQLFGIALNCMAYLKYAVNGVLPYRTKIMGNMFNAACETIFLLLLLLLAKGYTTTRGRLPLSASVKLTVFMCLYVITYLTLFIYEAKANFYYPFNICGTLWFVAGPAFILSANSYVDKWVRESVVCGVLLFITFAGHLMFLILTLPSMANKNFPYHIRTTQIGVMEVQGMTGTSTIDQFTHHVYQPTTIEQTVIIPLNAHTDDIFSGTQRAVVEEEPVSDEDKSDDEERRKSASNLDNVLKWSTVKGYVRPLDAMNHRRMGSSRSQMTVPEFENGPTASSPGAIFRIKETRTGDNSTPEWVRDVPVELFTISKMVINKPTN
ncbi:hypothetical protein CBL_13104 [Carabus blaptoides fortunei]